MYLKVKAKKIKNLSAKISQAKNNLVVNILNKKGYKCDNSQISQIKANRKLNSEQKKVILENQNEKVSKIGSYYVWEADVVVRYKIMWNIFLGIILSCLGVIAIAITLFVLVAILDTMIKQFKRK